MVLQGRVAVVTGGGRGIGRAIAELFYREGARVAIASRNTKNLQALTAELNTGDHRIVPFRCDVKDKDEVEVMIGNVVEVWDHVDILVNNAGVSGTTPLAPADEPGMDDRIEAKWQEILATNLTGLYYCTREAVRHMPTGGGGRVLNLSSVLGKFGVPGYAAYCASKHGVIGFTRALALELAPRQITVNALCPGWVDTDMAAQGIRDGAAGEGVPPEEFRRRAESRVPLGRFITPAEVARLALFLASDAGAGITGQSINIDGGAAMW
ncbi:MAG TPA: SDR family NAD(P)-dependent oxidoreductase [Candidatus Polarisedimenticolia bacterium]|jgi:NAD(P)-dependent dehydrogenase (short-subunit alcohol dehydrogenase family)|nr:SDR family NAD(P)-dependent oxidoreductase [Candidatus Polarisedimenticolia bacterium]